MKRTIYLASTLLIAIFFVLNTITPALARPEIDPAWTLIADLLSHYGEGEQKLGEGNQLPVSSEEKELYSAFYDLNTYCEIAIFNIPDKKIISIGKKDDGSWHSISWFNVPASAIKGNSLRIAKNYEALTSYSKGAVLLHVVDEGHNSMFISSPEDAARYVETEVILNNAPLSKEPNVTEQERAKFDEGTLIALSYLRDELGNEQNSMSLGAAGIRIYLEQNGIDVDKYSLDIEAYLGNVVLYTKRKDDGFWDAYLWTNVAVEEIETVQERLLLSYDEIDNLCADNLFMVFGFGNSENGFEIASRENAEQLYQKRFGFDAASYIDIINKSEASDNEKEALRCFALFAANIENPKSASPIQTFSATVTNPDYVLYLMDISNSAMSGKGSVNSYFIVYDSNSECLSAISFDGIVSDFNNVGIKNKVYAEILYLEDGIGSFIVNSLSLDLRTMSAYLKAFYDIYYK